MISPGSKRLITKIFNFDLNRLLCAPNVCSSYVTCGQKIFYQTISHPRIISLQEKCRQTTVYSKFHGIKFCTAPVPSLQVGSKVVVNVTVTAEMVKCFAQASGDWNPIHFDGSIESAKSGDRVSDEGSQLNTTPVVHGALLNGIVSGVIGTQLPGPGTVVVSQTFKFPAPLPVGSQAAVEVEVLDLRRREVNVRYRIASIPDATVVMDGTARLLVPRGRIK
ncbi:3-hydroxybutyryl-CoA dehydratase-like [Ischnura elegans]|uniref:3-hydroxybutyryl-CoA dehydratase-like n=1 Tax=Ischnura elegans TaxID=197161 RepID=UPI001ED892CC|nr:3-hydroxybutyryl-CoA dehydratase-like [Ischnura elegans]